MCIKQDAFTHAFVYVLKKWSEKIQLIKPVFHFNRVAAKRSGYISLSHEHSDRTNDMDTITLNVSLAEVENGLYEAF